MMYDQPKSATLRVLYWIIFAFFIAPCVFLVSPGFLDLQTYAIRISPSISPNLAALFASSPLDEAVASTLIASITVAGIGSILTFALTEIFIVAAGAVIFKSRSAAFRAALVACLILSLSFDPVLKTLALQRACNAAFDFFLSISAPFLAEALKKFISPAVTVTVIYFPIYLLSRILISFRNSREISKLSGTNAALFVHIPLMLGRLPTLISFMFFIILFDPWVSARATGNTVSFFGSYIFALGVNARGMNSALTLCILGMSLVMALYLSLCALRQLLLKLIYLLPPKVSNRNFVRNIRLDDAPGIVRKLIAWIFVAIILCAAMLPPVWLFCSEPKISIYEIIHNYLKIGRASCRERV